MLSEQLYQFKSRNLTGGHDADNAHSDRDIVLDFDLNEKIQKDKMVELLKRNHDVMMEKYETYRIRNEGLEKKALEKENLYVVIKSDNDKLASQIYQLKRQVEDFRQEKQLLDSKFTSADNQLRSVTEKANALQQKNDHVEG